MTAAKREYKTIGEVVEALSAIYPDLSISKVRFLEEEGLIAPDRTAGGYRKFSDVDVARVELVLRLQREHFLPLAVIRERLRDFDKGRMPSELKDAAPAARAESVALPFEDTQMVRVDDAPNVLGLPVSFLKELSEFGLIEPVAGEDGEELTRGDVGVAHTCWDLRRFGVEPRHLRMYVNFAEREAAFFSQILTPAFRHRTPETRQKLVDALSELTGLMDELKRQLLRRAVTGEFEDVG